MRARKDSPRFWALVGAALSVAILFYGFQVAYNLSGS
jgi:hypothetical protein